MAEQRRYSREGLLRNGGSGGHRGARIIGRAGAAHFGRDPARFEGVGEQVRKQNIRLLLIDRGPNLLWIYLRTTCEARLLF
jgi:hypothetical protein